MAFDLSAAVDTLVARMQSNPEEFDPQRDSTFGWLTKALLSPAGETQPLVIQVLDADEITRLRNGLVDMLRSQFNTTVMALLLSTKQDIPQRMKRVSIEDFTRTSYGKFFR